MPPAGSPKTGLTDGATIGVATTETGVAITETGEVVAAPRIDLVLPEVVDPLGLSTPGATGRPSTLSWTAVANDERLGSWKARRMQPQTTSLTLLLVVACNGSPASTDAKAGTETKADGRPTIDPAIAKKLADGVKAVRSVDATVRSEIAAAALAEAEVGRLPPELITAFADMQTVPPEMRNLIAMKSVATPAMLTPLEAMCSGKGTETLSKMAQVAPGDKIALVWDRCGLDAAGLVSRAQAERAALGPLVLAHLAHRVLTDKGGATPDELTLLRAFVVDSGGR
jgi:hypothetical protein